MANINNKTIRMQIYNQYDGHCAYCGKKLEYKQMQVDHIIPQRRNGSDDLSNVVCACARCNLYKRAFSLETFRRLIFEIPQKLMKVFIFKVGLDYGLVELHEKPIKFYYEQCNATNCINNQINYSKEKKSNEISIN